LAYRFRTLDALTVMLPLRSPKVKSDVRHNRIASDVRREKTRMRKEEKERKDKLDLPRVDLPLDVFSSDPGKTGRFVDVDGLDLLVAEDSLCGKGHVGEDIVVRCGRAEQRREGKEKDESGRLNLGGKDSSGTKNVKEQE
jgi:hypothetical protein